MARPANTPRLQAINATALAKEADDCAREYIASLALRLSPSARWSLDAEPSTLRHAVHVLTAYAQGRAGIDAPVTEYLQTICEALWIRPIDGAGYETPDVDAALHGDLDGLDDDLRGRLCLVMVAAVAREQLLQGHALSVAQLAALASRSPDHVRREAREGTLKLVEGADGLMCSAAQARKYLGAS